MRCPKCKGGNITSNKIKTHPVTGQIRHSFSAHSHPIIAAAIIAGQVLAFANNLLRHEYTCNDCKHTFSKSASACQNCTDSPQTLYELSCCQTLLCESCVVEITASSKQICEMCKNPLVRKAPASPPPSRKPQDEDDEDDSDLEDDD